MDKVKPKYCGCLYYSASSLSRIMTKMADEEFAAVGLSSSYAFLLMTVRDKPGIQPKEISFEMQLTPSTVTRLIEKMEVKKYLKREQCGRTTKVYPTKKSEELYPLIKTAWSNLSKRYSDVLGKEEGLELVARINNANDKLNESK